MNLPPPAIKPVVVEECAPYREPPIHPLSAVLLVVVDNLWNLAEWVVVDWVITIPLSFLSVFIPCYLIQRHLRRDKPGRAAAIAVLLAVLAAVPTSITGTPAGLAVLAWSGLSRLFRPKPRLLP